jgi:hypothetical protein
LEDWRKGDYIEMYSGRLADWRKDDCIPGDWKTGERMIISKCIPVERLIALREIKRLKKG